MKQIHLSETKLNQLATEISNRLFESHYFNQDVITGDALNNFCDHEQINKFLLFQVYQVWQLQISRFKHPYFNFEQAEVNQLLAQLQNLLSRNIAIRKEDFKPLLYKAVLNNLRLLTNPREAFQQFFFQNQDKIALEMYEKYSPFFSDFDFLINGIQRYYQKNRIRQVEKDVFLLKFDRAIEVYNQKSEQSADTYRSLRFLKLTDRRLDELVREDEEETALRKAREEEEAEKQRLLELKKEEEAARHAEEEKRKQQESLQAEEEEQKRVQKSFFDELPSTGKTFIDLEVDDPAIPSEIKQSTEEKKAIETIESSTPKAETVKDQIKEEEPFWKKLQGQSDVLPTQADRFKKPEADETPVETPIETPIEAPVEAPVESVEAVEEVREEPHVTSLIEEVQENAQETETIFNKVSDEKENQVDTKASIMDVVGNTDNKPTSLVDLLKAKGEEKSESLEARVRSRASEEVKEEGEEKEPKVEPKVELKEENKAEINKEEEKPAPPTQSTASGSLLDRFRQQTKKVDKKSPLASAKVEEQSPTIADKLKDQQIPASTEPEKKTEANTPKGKAAKADEIPIHKQYRFVQKVFGGNNVRFRIIVDKINNASSGQEVEEILEKYVFSNSDVNREDETVKEFIRLMRG